MGESEGPRGSLGPTLSRPREQRRPPPTRAFTSVLSRASYPCPGSRGSPAAISSKGTHARAIPPSFVAGCGRPGLCWLVGPSPITVPPRAQAGGTRGRWMGPRAALSVLGPNRDTNCLGFALAFASLVPQETGTSSFQQSLV